MSNFQLIESLIIILLIIRQIWVAIKLKKKIGILSFFPLDKIEFREVWFNKNLVNSPYSVLRSSFLFEQNTFPNDDVPIIQMKLLFINDDSENASFLRTIEEKLNIYLINNYADKITSKRIEEIVDNEFGLLDEEINHLLPTPLYIGLAATMFGIIMGLFSLNSGAITETLGIANLIKGVAIAMTSSLIGISLTTYFSVFMYRPTKRNTSFRKNSFFTKMRIALSIDHSSEEETEIQKLSNLLDRYNRKSKDSFVKLDSLSVQSDRNLSQQLMLVDQAVNDNSKKLLNSNKVNLEGLNNNIEKLKDFSNYWRDLNESILVSGDLVKNVQESAESFQNITELHSHIIKEQQDFTKVQEVFKTQVDWGSKNKDTLTTKFNSIKAELEDQIALFEKNSRDKNPEIEKGKAEFESSLRTMVDEVGLSLTNKTDKHNQALAKAYEGQGDRFGKLSHLNELTIIENKIDQFGDHQLEIELSRDVKVNGKLKHFEGVIDELSAKIKAQKNQIDLMEERLAYSADPYIYGIKSDDTLSEKKGLFANFKRSSRDFYLACKRNIIVALSFSLISSFVLAVLGIFFIWILVYFNIL